MKFISPNLYTSALLLANLGLTLAKSSETVYPECPNADFDQWNQSDFPEPTITIQNVESLGGDEYSVTVHFECDENMSIESLWELKIMTPVNQLIYSENAKIFSISNPKDFTYTFDTTSTSSYNGVTGEVCIPAVSFQFDWCTKSTEECSSWKYADSYDVYTGCQDPTHKSGPLYCFKPTSSSSSSVAPSSAVSSSVASSSVASSSAVSSSVVSSSAVSSSVVSSSAVSSSVGSSSAVSSSVGSSSAVSSSAVSSSVISSSAVSSSVASSSAVSSSVASSSAVSSSAVSSSVISSSVVSSSVTPSSSITSSTASNCVQTVYPECPNADFDQWNQSDFPEPTITIQNVESLGGDEYSVTVHFECDENMSIESLWELKIMTPVNQLIYSENAKIFSISNPKDFTYTFDTTSTSSYNGVTGEVCIPAVSFQFDWCTKSTEECSSWKYADSYDVYTGCQDPTHKSGPLYCFKPTNCSAPNSSSSSVAPSSAVSSSVASSSVASSSAVSSSVVSSSAVSSSVGSSSAVSSSVASSSAVSSSAVSSSVGSSSAVSSSVASSSAVSSSVASSSAVSSSVVSSSAVSSSVGSSSAVSSSVGSSSAVSSSVASSSAGSSSAVSSSAASSSVAPSSAVASSSPSSSIVSSATYATSEISSKISSIESKSKTTDVIPRTETITVTSCSDNHCYTSTITTGVVTITKGSTTYTTYCPLTTSESTSPTSDVIPATETITVTSCSDNHCYTSTITTGVVTISKESTIYTTYCPLTTKSKSAGLESHITTLSKTTSPSVTAVTTSPALSSSYYSTAVPTSISQLQGGANSLTTSFSVLVAAAALFLW